ncbi:hypothetical protein T439DRAFT_329152 [Meredithblackwellia eburnea MCA 4105]
MSGPPLLSRSASSSNHVQISIHADSAAPSASPSASPSIQQSSWTRPSAPAISFNLRSSQGTSSQAPAEARTDGACGSGPVSVEAIGAGIGSSGPGGWWPEWASVSSATGPTPSSKRLLTGKGMPNSLSSTHSRRISHNQHPRRWSPSSAVDLAVRTLSTLWVDEPEHHHPAPDQTHHHHLHGDEDIPRAPHSSSRPFVRRLRASLFNNPRDLLQLSRTGYIVVIFLLLLGIREVVVYSSSISSSSRRKTPITKLDGRDPFDVLASFAPRKSHPSGALVAQDRLWIAGIENSEKAVDDVEGDVTAIVLHWKRTDNVIVIVASLCQYSFFGSVLVWNNNPNIQLSRETFASTGCPSSRLRIYNSPRNMLFLARYLACAHASTPNCFFQDDDWLVRPLRALYSQFSRDPDGPVVVHTSPEVATLYGLEWCFYLQESPLHTCFAWVGTGAFVAKSHVTRFLETITTIGYSEEELSHADNSFTLFQNEPPYVLTSELAQLPQPFGHSDGAGIARNKRIIQQGLVHLVNYLTMVSGVALPPAKIPITPFSVDTSAYFATPMPPLTPHPYTHHVRSPCADDSCLFLTNIALLPPPDSAPYPGPSVVKTLEEWENHLGPTARGWMEGGELFNEEEAWAAHWPYAAAVDGFHGTAFRSPDVIHKGEYVGIGLLAPVDPQWIPKLALHFVLEDYAEVSNILSFEVSGDGYRWVDPQPTPLGPLPVPICRSIAHSSTLPTPSFPKLRSSSKTALRVIEEEDHPSNTLLGNWWRKRRRRARRLTECKVELATVLYREAGLGWRFARIKSTGEGEVGWGVYHIWIQ